MARKPQPWFRFYVESIGDRKVRRLSMTQRWIWLAVLSAAGDSPERGYLLVAEGVPMTADEIAEFAGVKVREVSDALTLMITLQMITVVEDDVLKVTNWHKRQYESDSSTPRTRTHRERSKERSNDVLGTAIGTHQRQRTETKKNSPTSPGSRNAPAGFAPRIVRAYCESARDAGLPSPEESQARVERSARSLLAQGYEADAIEDAARNAALGGWTDLATQLQRDASRASPATNGTASTADQRFQAGIDLADQLERKALP